MKLKIAIQKSGRLTDDSLKLLKECGINIQNGLDQLKAVASNFPVEILFLRNSDIPKYLESGTVDAGIIGSNILIEQQCCFETPIQLGFSKCSIDIAIPKNESYNSIKDLNGKRIATSYPYTLQKFLDENEINCEIHKISGSVEIAPNIGLADAIMDIVSSGSTLFKNGLKSFYRVMESQAVLAVSPKISQEETTLLNQLIFRIESVQKAKNKKYILLNAPENKVWEISQILPVLKSPTVLPLAEKGWVSLHSVISDNDFWEVIDQLKNAGAQDILIVPIEKMVA